MAPPDPLLLQATQQANAAWAAVGEARRLFWVSVVGAAVNFALAAAAIGVPVWQRRMMLRDADRTQREAWRRLIDALRSLTGAQDEVVAAAQLQNPQAARAFALVEPRLVNAVEILKDTSVGAFSVAIAMDVASALRLADEMIGQYPELRIYGSNLLTYDELSSELIRIRDDTLELLARVEARGVAVSPNSK